MDWHSILCNIVFKKAIPCWRERRRKLDLSFILQLGVCSGRVLQEFLVFSVGDEGQRAGREGDGGVLPCSLLEGVGFTV